MALKGWHHLSVEEYLEGEKDAPVRHEYVGGEVFALAGASDVHNTVSLNIALALQPAARQKGCRVYASDMKVRTSGDVFYYPDVIFVCQDGPDAYYKDHPCVIVEVMSPSTLRTDLFEKRYAYQAVPSVQLYLLVDSRRQAVVGYYHSKDGWDVRSFDESVTVPIPCAEVSLSMVDIYVQTPFV